MNMHEQPTPRSSVRDLSEQERRQRRNKLILLGATGTLAGLLFLSLATPAVQCSLNLSAKACVVDGRDMDIYMQNESGTVLPGVNVEWTAGSRTLNELSNSDGIARVRIPASGDTKFTFTASGYPEQVIAINFDRDPKPIRVIRLVPKGEPLVRSVSTPAEVVVVAPPIVPPVSSPSPQPIVTTPASQPSPSVAVSNPTAPSPAASVPTPEPSIAANAGVYEDSQLKARVTSASLDSTKLLAASLSLRNKSGQDILLALAQKPRVSTSTGSTEACLVQGLPTVTDLPSDPKQASPSSFYRLPAGSEIQLSVRCSEPLAVTPVPNRLNLSLPIISLTNSQYQPLTMAMDGIPLK